MDNATTMYFFARYALEDVAEFEYLVDVYLRVCECLRFSYLRLTPLTAATTSTSGHSCSPVISKNSVNSS